MKLDINDLNNLKNNIKNSINNGTMQKAFDDITGGVFKKPEVVRICPNCGASNKAESIFCDSCGNKFPKEFDRKDTRYKNVNPEPSYSDRVDYDDYERYESDDDATYKMECNSCGAQLDLDLENIQACCPYCGTKILLDEKLNKILREKEETKRFQAEQNAKIRQKQIELEYAERSEKRDNKQFWLIIILLVVFYFGIMGSLEISDKVGDKRHLSNGEIQPPYSASRYIDDKYYYEDVVQSLQSAGFTNIEVEPTEFGLKDMFKKTGTVARISINGDNSFSSSSWFQPDANVVIRYLSSGSSSTQKDNSETESIDTNTNSVNNAYNEINDLIQDIYSDIEQGNYKIAQQKIDEAMSSDILSDVIKSELESAKEKVTQNIDTSTTSAKESTQNIDTSTASAKESTQNIDTSTASAKESEKKESENKAVSSSSKPVSSENKKTEFVDDKLYYHSGNLESAKKGNSGVFAYRQKSRGSYTNYVIIDFDEGYVYSFSYGNGSDTCERVAIDSGTLNDAVKITYNDNGTTWSYKYYFHYVSNPSGVLILLDNNGFEIEYIPTDLNDALKIRRELRIVNY